MSCHRMNTKKPTLGDNLTYERSGDKDKVLITSIVNFYKDKMFCPSKLIYSLYCMYILKSSRSTEVDTGMFELTSTPWRRNFSVAPAPPSACGKEIDISLGH